MLNYYKETNNFLDFGYVQNIVKPIYKGKFRDG